MALDRLDDPDHPTFGMSQAADLLDVPQAFLRSLDAAGLLTPARSEGGHRRYSRHQLDRVAALRALADEGHTLASASEILDLRSDLDHERTLRTETTDERDEARRERDEAREQRDSALDERDTARRERDEARDAGAPVDLHADKAD
jgi:MerR family transcriptional regulator/heat shock protein HspR